MMATWLIITVMVMLPTFAVLMDYCDGRVDLGPRQVLFITMLAILLALCWPLSLAVYVAAALYFNDWVWWE